jgi:putative two-component system response regulator
MKPDVVELLQKAAPLYDIGKIGVPSEILRKPGALSAPDLERVRRHPQLGAEIIGEHKDAVLALARLLALTHHERWDGSGYPKGLKASEIPWPGRVMGIVDTFEAMTTTQFYRQQPFTADEAAKTVREGFGTLFDPSLKDAFEKALPVMKKVRDTYSDALGDMINLDFSPTRGMPEKPTLPKPGAPAVPKAAAPAASKAAAPAAPRPAAHATSKTAPAKPPAPKR